MFNVTKIERQIGGRTLSIETGRIARQADGAVLVKYGETVVLVAATTSPPRNEDIDYFPLSVDYRERHSAAGKFPGGFIKREGRPSTKETLTARQIDRPIRPLFPEGYFQEVQIMATVLSFDGENDPDVLAMIGASAALSISKIPFLGPIGACRMTRIDGEFVVNPTHKQLEQGDLNLLLGGRKEAMNMIEVSAKQLPEDVIADAIAEAQKSVADVCDLIDELVSKAGVEKECPLAEDNPELAGEIEKEFFGQLYEAKQIADKKQRKQKVREILDAIIEKYCSESAQQQYSKAMVKRMLDKMQGNLLKKLLLEGKGRTEEVMKM
ncbi:MAG: hypothetical protein H8D47_02025 [Planctomycetes bacterium]|nr:hypothetical protein [Planctomycetota bacterium]